MVPCKGVADLSVLTIARSPVGFRLFVSVEVLLLGAGSVQSEGGVMVAVLDRVLVAEDALRPVSVKAADPTPSRFTNALEKCSVPLGALPENQDLEDTAYGAF